MILANRRAFLLASSGLCAAADTTLLFLLGCIPAPPLAAAAAQATAATGASTVSVTPAVDAAGVAYSYFTVPTPTAWLPDIIDVNDPHLIWKDVVTCCQRRQSCEASADEGDSSSSCINPDTTTTSPDEAAAASLELQKLSRIPQFTTTQTLQVLEVAKQAWANGNGAWTQLSLTERCQALQKFFSQLQLRREEMVQTLMYEIGKNRIDAEAEFDRTIDFGRQVLALVQSNPDYMGSWQSIGSTTAFVKRNAVGIYLSLAPYNYPLNECYAAIVPCLLMGNVVILKLPTIGGLVHLWTIEALRDTLPPGTVSFVAGTGRSTMPPLMETGHIDGLAFIGSSKAADDLIQRHPQPHRLKVFLQLEANNLAVYLPDVFDDAKSPGLFDTALQQAVLGSLSYNGQRCTALKLHCVPKQHAETFVTELVQRVDALNVGLPGDVHPNGSPSQITPLPSPGRISYMNELLQDALQKGAKIVNRDGGKVLGGKDSTLMVPAVLFPVTSDMRVYHEEQFGPLVPVTVYDTLDDVLRFAQDENPFGQQISLFGSVESSDAIVAAVDRFSAVFGRINLNAQCGRSPDTIPFSGRRSSAMGVMSVSDALREFSTPTVVAYSNANPASAALVEELKRKSQFLR